MWKVLIIVGGFTVGPLLMLWGLAEFSGNAVFRLYGLTLFGMGISLTAWGVSQFGWAVLFRRFSACAFMLTGVLCFLRSDHYASDGFWPGLICLSLGISLFFPSRVFGKKNALRKRYIDLIKEHDITSIDDIASITDVQSNHVMFDLRNMIGEGFFPGALLDETKRVFVSGRYVRCLELIENQGITSISDIATITKTLSEDVMADLRKMLDNGFFPGASLDETKQVIVLARYKQYMELIENQGVTLINDIAIKTGALYANVVVDLQRMIKADFFPGASLDTAKGAIVWVPQSVASAPGVVQIVQVQQAPQTPREKVIACPSCGANNKIMSGKVTECQYCGALIQ